MLHDQIGQGCLIVKCALEKVHFEWKEMRKMFLFVEMMVYLWGQKDLIALWQLCA